MPVSYRLIEDKDMQVSSENDANTNVTDESHSIIDIGKNVIGGEIEGLQMLRDSLGQSFSDAVNIIHTMKSRSSNSGRLIVAGIGKSGHIARKLAATLSSTGTPSFFVHPGEASHGDLGMVSFSDTILMLSNSGENDELSDLIHYTRRHGITLISITSNSQSTLAKHSDIVLNLPEAPEVCLNGLAPTTSTTMMMALGDALAVALTQKMGLTKEQFKMLHPGGKLGQKLRTVKDLMHAYDKLPLVSEDDTMDKAIIVLSERNLGLIIVIDKINRMRGIITDGDLKRHMSNDLLSKKVTDIMSENPVTIEEDCLAAEALAVMTKMPGKYLTSLIVTKDGELSGMIRLQDCLQAGVA